MLKMMSPQPGGAASALPEQNILAEIFNAAVAAVDPCNAVLNSVHVENDRLVVGRKSYDLGAFERLVVVGAGKATARMALAVESLLGNRIAAGLIVVKEGHTVPLSIVEQVEASHPVPNEAGQVGTQRILQLMRNADDKTLVICLLSGGASALLVAPEEDVTLRDKQETTRLLLNAGASINELNAVRKHLSAIKGGRLAEAAYPAQLLTLILSDVIGDPLDVIASGPTAADSSTFADAWSVIAKFGLQKTLPSHVADHLRRGIARKELETVKANDACLGKTDNVIIAGIRQALSAAQAKARRLGLESITISDALQGEARDAAHSLAQTALSELALMKPGKQRCLLCGGETTVTVRGNGRGGRNQELALAFALEIDGVSGVSLLSAGTDGGDGPTDAAGAFADGNIVALARSHGIDPLRYLDRNDSYDFFRQLDAASGMQYHFKTGPTGTNVMDIQFLLLHKLE
ncbi:glycerate kinase type-2 family protein [Sideroxydans lithotrophicus]|nr:glycerate kinase [Sideroxydans lithotrophicus]